MLVQADPMVDFISEPQNYLYSLDLQKGLFEFVNVSRQELSELSFLDNRTNIWKENIKGAQAPQVFQALQKIDFQKDFNRPNYLFHTSFCCSTVIARCLDQAGKNLSLKEPRALLGLAAFKQFSTVFDPTSHNWRNLRDITLYLLSRPFETGEKVLIKPSNGANGILPEVVSCPNTARVLLLYGEFEGFITSVLRGGKIRIASVKPIMEGLVRDSAGKLLIDPGKIASLSLLQQLALVWGLQMQNFADIAARDKNQKVKTLNCRVFLEKPDETLSKLSDFYGLGFSDKERAEIKNGPAFKTHSKMPSKPFSRHQAAQEKENILKRFGKDIQDAESWVKSLGYDFETGLANPL